MYFCYQLKAQCDPRVSNPQRIYLLKFYTYWHHSRPLKRFFISSSLQIKEEEEKNGAVPYGDEEKQDPVCSLEPHGFETSKKTSNGSLSTSCRYG